MVKTCTEGFPAKKSSPQKNHPIFQFKKNPPWVFSIAHLPIGL
jgi:hypothetical protein